MTVKPEKGDLARAEQAKAEPVRAHNAVATRPARYLVHGSGDPGGIEDTEVLRRLTGPDGRTVASLRLSREAAERLRRGGWTVEVDERLAAAAAPVMVCDPGVSTPPGPGFSATFQISGGGSGEAVHPLAGAEVHLFGGVWAAHGRTGSDGTVTLNLFGESADSLTGLFVRPQVGYWSGWHRDPLLRADGVNTVFLRPLAGLTPWAPTALGLERKPTDWQGQGVKIAVVDSGTADQRLTQAKGIDLADGGDGWRRDELGHGTAVAAILASIAPAAELLICKLPPLPHAGDLMAALDWCEEQGADVVCIGFTCTNGSGIVEQRMRQARDRGLAVIAAAGSDGGPVRFPGSSPHVLAVGAVGRRGTYPADSYHLTYETGAEEEGEEYYAPAFSCGGPELDICAPGVAVACEGPDGLMIRDGTSVAAPHLAGLAALVLAHHGDFRNAFARRDGRRVERLFQILKETAEPLAEGDPERTGAGLPHAPRALGLESASADPLDLLRRKIGRMAPLADNRPSGLAQMREALQLAGLASTGDASEAPRGPARTGHWPLSPPRPDPETHLQGLRNAMQRCGLVGLN